MLGVFVQARLKGIRFPGKVFEDITGYKKLIDVNLEAARQIPADEYALLVPYDEREFFRTHAYQYGFEIVEGPEEDVLGRFIVAAKEYSDLDYIVRICGDKPIISLLHMKRALKEHENYDLTFYSKEPVKSTTGGIFRVSSLMSADLMFPLQQFAKKREHIKPIFTDNPVFWNINELSVEEKYKPLSNYIKLSVDGLNDLNEIRKVFEDNATPLTLDDLLGYYNL
jgi:spore coat polysaccharide biosynthesis protein SpsF (cytidylyltransferase family)